MKSFSALAAAGLAVALALSAAGAAQAAKIYWTITGDFNASGVFEATFTYDRDAAQPYQDFTLQFYSVNEDGRTPFGLPVNEETIGSNWGGMFGGDFGYFKGVRVTWLAAVPYPGTPSISFGPNTFQNSAFREVAMGNQKDAYGNVLWTFSNMTATAYVPEPQSWALMIAGFGLAGAGLRARRRAIA